MTPASYAPLVPAICALLASVGEGEPSSDGPEADLYEDVRYQALLSLEAILTHWGYTKGA